MSDVHFVGVGRKRIIALHYTLFNNVIDIDHLLRLTLSVTVSVCGTLVLLRLTLSVTVSVCGTLGLMLLSKNRQ